MQENAFFPRRCRASNSTILVIPLDSARVPWYQNNTLGFAPRGSYRKVPVFGLKLASGWSCRQVSVLSSAMPRPSVARPRRRRPAPGASLLRATSSSSLVPEMQPAVPAAHRSTGAAASRLCRQSRSRRQLVNSGPHTLRQRARSSSLYTWSAAFHSPRLVCDAH